MQLSSLIDRLRVSLDANGFGHTVRLIGKGKRDRMRRGWKAKREYKRWQQKQVADAVQHGQAAGILPSGLAWLAIKLIVEWWIRKYLFGASK